MNPPNDIASEIVHAIRSVVGFGPVGLHEPSFDGRELDYLRECLDSTFVSSVGMFVDKFEDELAKFTGAKHAIAVVNGTSALHVALKLAGVQAGDLLDAERASMRDEILIAVNDAKLMSRPVWELISNLVPFQNCQAMDLDQAKQLAKRIINIPSSYQLSVGDHEQT